MQNLECNIIHKREGNGGESNYPLINNWSSIHIQEYRKAQLIGRINGIPQVRKYSRSPDEDDRRVQSIYVDVAYCDLKLTYTTGFAIFDPGGVIIAADCKSLKPPGTIMAAELEAIHNSIRFGIANTAGQWAVFSNSLDVIHAV